MKVIHQTIRGCGNLPYVGKHPGTGILFIFLVMGAIAGERGGFLGTIVGAAFMGIFIVPMYLCAAYSRANLSDKIVRSKQ